jgi:hypothetical protein
MASSRWRLRRISIMETALFKRTLREQQELLGPDADPQDIREAAYIAVAESKTTRMLVRHAAQLRRAYEKAWKELEAIQSRRENDDETQLQNEPTDGMTMEMLDILTAPPTPYTNTTLLAASPGDR